MGRFKLLAGVATALSLALSGGAQASVIFTGSLLNTSGNTDTAQATFSISGNTLTVELKNTSPAPSGSNKFHNSDSLSAISFAYAGVTLATVSASSPNAIYNSSGCTVLACGGVPQNVGAEWALSNAFPAAGVFGISSSGFGFFGNGNFATVGFNLAGPSGGSNYAVDGEQFGILSINAALDHSNVANLLLTDPFIRDRVIFTLTLSGLNSFLESGISNVTFWYGTAFEGGNNTSGCPGAEVGACDVNVPEPGSLSLMLIGLLGLTALGFAVGPKANS